VPRSSGSTTGSGWHDDTVSPVDAIFVPLGGGRYRPTEHSVGPWDPGSLHGGAPCALMAGALQAAVVDADLGADFFPARFTAELTRPVPLADLDVTTVVRRPGRRICVVDAALSGPDGTVVATATLQSIRVRPFERAVPRPVAPPPGPETGVPLAAETLDGPSAFHRTGTEHRGVLGTSFEAPGPATDWIRLAAPLVEGRETTPLERVVAAADFGNGVSKLFDMDDVLFVNPDLTVLLHRLPVGEWICLDAVTHLGPDGVGLAESVLFDAEGPLGRSAQTLLVEER